MSAHILGVRMQISFGKSCGLCHSKSAFSEMNQTNIVRKFIKVHNDLVNDLIMFFFVFPLAAFALLGPPPTSPAAGAAQRKSLEGVLWRGEIEGLSGYWANWLTAFNDIHVGLDTSGFKEVWYDMNILTLTLHLKPMYPTHDTSTNYHVKIMLKLSRHMARTNFVVVGSCF